MLERDEMVTLAAWEMVLYKTLARMDHMVRPKSSE